MMRNKTLVFKCKAYRRSVVCDTPDHTTGRERDLLAGTAIPDATIQCCLRELRGPQRHKELASRDFEFMGPPGGSGHLSKVRGNLRICTIHQASLNG